MPNPVEDACYATIEYPGNVIAHMHASWINPQKVRQITVVGDRRMAVWDDIDLTRTITIYDRRVDQPNRELVDSFGSHRMILHMGDVLVPNDATVLFTPAGMNQFKREFMGLGDPSFTRATAYTRNFGTANVTRPSFTSNFTSTPSGSSGVTTRTPVTFAPRGSTTSAVTPSAASGFSSLMPPPGLRFFSGSVRL